MSKRMFNIVAAISLVVILGAATFMATRGSGTQICVTHNGIKRCESTAQVQQQLQQFSKAVTQFNHQMK